jgi:GNAT superfamily N-acetyltransferase
VPIGLAWGRIEAAETAHVYQMWVAPTHRRAGVGRLLLNAIIEWASSRVRYLVLGVTTGNAAAESLYSRAGFVPVGEPSKIWGEAAPLAQVMQLDL